MANGYTRGFSKITDDVIQASDFNNEFQALEDVFHNSTGHVHDGTLGEGSYVPLISDLDNMNAIQIDTTNNEIDIFTEVATVKTQQLKITDGAVLPFVDSDIDLGSSSLRYKSIWADTLDGAVIGGTTPAAGTFTTFTSTGIDDNAVSTALTLDSSQNATFSGDVNINNATPVLALQASADTEIPQIQFENAAGADRSVLRHVLNSGTNDYGSWHVYDYGQTYLATEVRIMESGQFTVATGGNGVGNAVNALTLDSSQDATFAGSIVCDKNVSISSSTDYTPRLDLIHNSGLGAGYVMFQSKSSTGTQLSTGNTLGTIMWQPWTGSAFQNGANITCTATLNHSGTATPTNIVFSTTDASGVSQTALTLDSSQRLSTGNATALGAEAGSVTISTGDSGVTAANANADDLIVEGDGITGISVLSPDANSARLVLGSASDNVGALVSWDYGTAGANQELQISTNSASGYITFKTATGSEAMRIDSSGSVLIGDTALLTNQAAGAMLLSVGDSGVTTVESSADDFVIERNANVGITLASPDVNSGNIHWQSPSGSGTPHCAIGGRYNSGSPFLAFYTNNSEAMRIDSSGNLLVGTTSTTIGSANFGIKLTSTGQVAASINVSGTGNAHQFFGNAGVAYIKGDGDLENTNNSYGAISDERLKENIVSANSQWDDIKNIEVVNYNFIEYPDRPQIGVIAQQVEPVSAGLVKTDDDGMKSVKYSVLYMKAVKALQEAMVRIEALEVEVQALKGA